MGHKTLPTRAKSVAGQSQLLQKITGMLFPLVDSIHSNQDTSQAPELGF